MCYLATSKKAFISTCSTTCHFKLKKLRVLFCTKLLLQNLFQPLVFVWQYGCYSSSSTARLCMQMGFAPFEALTTLCGTARHKLINSRALLALLSTLSTALCTLRHLNLKKQQSIQFICLILLQILSIMSYKQSSESHQRVIVL